MWHLLHFLVICAEFLLGVFCVLTAFVLYPGEEGKVQSKFEDFWIRLDDFQGIALSRHAAFMTKVAELETRLLDSMFGKRLISHQALLVSFVCSTVAVMSMQWVVHEAAFETPAYAEWKSFFDFQVLVLFAVSSVCALFIGLISILALVSTGIAGLKNNFLVFAIGCACLLWSVWVFMRFRHHWRDDLVFVRDHFRGANHLSAALFIALALGFLCDLSFVIVTRAVLRRTANMKSFLGVVVALVCTLALALALFSPYVVAHRLGRPPGDSVAGVAYLVGAGNLFDVGLALLFGLLVATLLIHQIAWPILTRTIFRIQEIGTKGRRAMLVVMGTALLSLSGVHLPELAKEIGKALG